jgi:hypothetical protein
VKWNHIVLIVGIEEPLSNNCFAGVIFEEAFVSIAFLAGVFQ